MSGIVEELRDRVYELESMVVKLCRRAGHPEWMDAWPRCERHLNKRNGFFEQCTLCHAYRCCEEEAEK